MHILVVEDDKSISDLIKIHLELNEFKVCQAYNGLEGKESVETNDYDLIILDLMMPTMSGYELLPVLREKGIPVIILSAKNQLEDKVKGFHLGADDYLTKPFEAIELMMRVKAVLSRTSKSVTTYIKHGLTIEWKKRLVYKEEKLIDLTLKEYELLMYLIENEGIALSRNQLLEAVWDYDFMGESRTVDTHIQKLRKKLEIPIETIYKYGYRLEA